MRGGCIRRLECRPLGAISAILGARGFSRAVISLILHASNVSYILASLILFTRGFAARCWPPAGRSAFGRPRDLTKACRERTSELQGASPLH